MRKELAEQQWQFMITQDRGGSETRGTRGGLQVHFNKAERHFFSFINLRSRQYFRSPFLIPTRTKFLIPSNKSGPGRAKIVFSQQTVTDPYVRPIGTLFDSTIDPLQGKYCRNSGAFPVSRLFEANCRSPPQLIRTLMHDHTINPKPKLQTFHLYLRF